jgi:hypothetical protein
MPPGGIRTRNPSRGAAADPRLRSLGHWDRQTIDIQDKIVNNLYAFTYKALSKGWVGYVACMREKRNKYRAFVEKGKRLTKSTCCMLRNSIKVNFEQ